LKYRGAIVGKVERDTRKEAGALKGSQDTCKKAGSLRREKERGREGRGVQAVDFCWDQERGGKACLTAKKTPGRELKS